MFSTSCQTQAEDCTLIVVHAVLHEFDSLHCNIAWEIAGQCLYITFKVETGRIGWLVIYKDMYIE